jgi:hypothetical protein
MILKPEKSNSDSETHWQVSQLLREMMLFIGTRFSNLYTAGPRVYLKEGTYHTRLGVV